GKIITTRNVSLTSTTDKEDASVSYGFIGYHDTVPANVYKVNNATINATGQKTLDVASINAVGDVNLTTHFTQQGSRANYGANINAYTIGRNVTIKHTSETNVTDGELYVRNLLKASGDLNVTASGYKTLKIGDTTNATQVGGAANINTTATVAGSTITFVMGITGATNGININASAANGVRDAVLSYGSLIANAKDINITTTNQKTVTIGAINAGGNTAATRGDVNISMTTDIDGSAVTTGRISSNMKNATLKFEGQKTLTVGDVVAEEYLTSGVKNFGKINIDVKGNGSEAAATFGNISGVNVAFNANNLKNLTLGAVTAEKDLTIKTGTNNNLDKVVFLGNITGKTVNIDASNATAPLTDTDTSTPTPPVVNVFVKSEANIKTYGADSLNTFLIKLNPTLASEKDFTANLTNVRGIINSNTGANSITETLTVKGGVTNPDSVAVAYNPVHYGGISLANYATLTIETGNMTALKSIDYSAYHNTIGQAHVQAANEALESIIGSNTTRTYIDVVSTGSSTKIKNIKTGAGNDLVDFQKTQENNVRVELGAGNDEIRLQSALRENKKFEISGGAGNDKFILGAAKTDASASKYVTITDIARGDKINLGTATAFEKYTATNLDSEATLKDAINKVLTSSGANVANKIWAFSYGNETYLVRDDDGNNTALSGADNLVKLAGLAHFDYFSANLNSNLLEITNA
uniref:hypothetical protein n=1 Tax=uncultured Campylobacter sp. TaxID=218934 RepID=UPI0028E208E1